MKFETDFFPLFPSSVMGIFISIYLEWFAAGMFITLTCTSKTPKRFPPVNQYSPKQKLSNQPRPSYVICSGIQTAQLHKHHDTILHVITSGTNAQLPRRGIKCLYSGRCYTSLISPILLCVSSLLTWNQRHLSAPASLTKVFVSNWTGIILH